MERRGALTLSDQDKSLFTKGPLSPKAKRTVYAEVQQGILRLASAWDVHSGVKDSRLE